MSTPNLPVMIRVYYVVNPNSGDYTPKSPFTPSGEDYVRYNNNEDNLEEDLQVFLPQCLSDAAIILDKLGICLILHPESPQQIVSEKLFEINSNNFQELISFEWEPSQPWVNIYFVWTLAFEEQSETHGIAVFNGGNDPPNQQKCGIILSGIANGPILAHDLGHMLGLPHTYRVDTLISSNPDGSTSFEGFRIEDWAEFGDHLFSTLAMMPFEDDTKLLNNSNELVKNPMSYFLKAGDEFIADDLIWTPNQILRSKLTILSRRSNLAYFCNPGEFNPQYPPLPDFCPSYIAAWMG